MANIKFWLDGCDICFLAEAPEDIKLKDLLEYYGIKWRKNIQKKCNEKYQKYC